MKKYSRRYINKIIADSSTLLKNSNHSFCDIFNVSFRFETNRMFEWNDLSEIKSFTYEQIKNKIFGFAAQLDAKLKDYKKDSFVALKLDNSPKWIISFWAILMAGYRPLLINTRMDDLYNECLIKRMDCLYIISDKPFSSFKVVIPSYDAIVSQEQFDSKHWGNAIALSTSGTTGEPKICLYEGQAICEQILNTTYIVKKNHDICGFYNDQLKQLAFLPFYHIFGLTAMFLWYSAFGREFVILKDYSSNAIKDTVNLHSVTQFFAIPMVWNITVDKLEKEISLRGDKTKKKFEKGLQISTKLQDIFPKFGKMFAKKIFHEVRENMFGDSLQFCITGGGFIKERTLYVLNALGYSIYNGYGMSEIGITSVELRKKAKERNIGSIGKPFPSVSYTLNSDNELLIKGHSLYSKIFIHDKWYDRNPDEFFHTGDIAYMDKYGYFYIKGRKDDLIISDNGELISPDYVESFFKSDYLDGLCVLSVPSSNDLMFIAHQQDSLNDIQLIKLINNIKTSIEGIPSFMRPRYYYFSKNALPSLMKGNIQRSSLSKLFVSNKENFTLIDFTNIDHNRYANVLNEATNKLALEICEIFKEVFEKDINQNININFITDLEGNSMQYFEVVHMIFEKYHIEILFDANHPLLTPLDFAKYVEEKS
jgi:long-subunit acyl-CoA synthetase (AMP-forming)